MTNDEMLKATSGSDFDVAVGSEQQRVVMLLETVHANGLISLYF
jgi:hypothetical protein